MAVGLATLGGLLFAKFPSSRQIIKACFIDAGGLRSGASVRIAGVEVGFVRNIRVNPQRKDCPAEVEMGLTTTYDIPIPKDSLAETLEAGVLGPRYVSIDTSLATGPPIENYGYLKGKMSGISSPVDGLVKTLNDMIEKVKPTNPATNPAQETPSTRPKKSPH